MKSMDAIKELVQTSMMDRYTEQVRKLSKEAAEINIADMENCQNAIDIYIQIKKIESLIETKRKLFKNPYLDIINFIDKTAKNATEKLSKIREGLQEEINNYCLGYDTNVSATLGTATISHKTTWMIHNHTQLPPEIVNARHEQITKAIAPKVHDMIKAGVDSIPGIFIAEEDIVKITTNRINMENSDDRTAA